MNWFSRLIFCLLLLALAVAVADLHAQAAPAGEKKDTPPRRLRLLPIGDAPPHREEIVDDVRIHLPAPQGSIPPRLLSAWIGPESRVELNPQLGRISPALDLPADLKRLSLLEGQAPRDAPAWLSIDLPPHGDHLAVLTRSGKSPTWSTPAILLLPDDPISFPAGRVLFLNLAAVELPVQLGNEKFSLLPGRPISRDTGAVRGLAFKAAHLAAGGRPVFFFRGEILLNPGERALALLYAADGVQPRQPLKLLFLKERAPALPSPPLP